MVNLPEFNPDQSHLLHGNLNDKKQTPSVFKKIKLILSAALLLFGISTNVTAAPQVDSNQPLDKNSGALAAARQPKVAPQAWILYQMSQAMKIMGPAWHTSHYSHSSHSSHSSHHSHYSSRY